MSQQPAVEPVEDLHERMRVRRAKREALLEAGTDA